VLTHIRLLLTADAAEMVAHGIARLDYCNSLLNGVTDKNIDRLQVAQNTLACAVYQASWPVSAMNTEISTLAADMSARRL
jgi:hypothetical protein